MYALVPLPDRVGTVARVVGERFDEPQFAVKCAQVVAGPGFESFEPSLVLDDADDGQPKERERHHRDLHVCDHDVPAVALIEALEPWVSR